MWRLTVVFVLALVAVASHGAAAARAASCVNAMPVSAVATATNGSSELAANGLTVSRGIDPERFDVTVLGVLEDGIAPGVDMIIVKAKSTALDDAKGIWAGMSGSPVYEGNTTDGRLIGAVAYGLSFGPSMIGGLAAAEDMSRLLDIPAAAQKTTAQLSRALQSKVVATGAATARQAEAGLQRLRLPLGVSGVRGRHLPAFARLLGSGSFIPYSAGTTAATAGNRAEIKAGSNFAAALSYGDVSAAGVGTTTAVCDGRAIAFGHPMTFAGPTALSAHTASAITIQDDPTFVPYKLANVGGVVGTLDQDRLAGIRALLGPAPAPIDVESKVTDPVRERTGLTSVNRTVDVPGIAAGHLLANIDRVIDRIGAGGSRVGWTVTGTVGGERFSLTRNNRFADPADIAIASSGELAEQLSELADNPFADVTFDGVTIDAAVGAFQRYRITGLQRHNGADWVRVDPAAPLPVAPGATLRVRVLLAAHRSDAPVPPVELSFAIPQDAAGSEGSLDVLGGTGSFEEGGFFEELGFGGGPESGPEPASFRELLASLQDAQRGDERVAEVVSGSLSVTVRVEGGEPPFPGEPFPDEPGRRGGRLALGGRSTQKLATALKRGVRLTVRTSGPGRLVLRALVSRSAARKHGLRKRVVGSLTRRVGGGRTAVKLKLKPGARKRLQDARRVKLTIHARVTTLGGGRRADRFSVVLKRRG